MKSSEHIIASCIRMEQEKNTGKIFLVFEIIDEEFRKRIKENWAQDIELKLIGYDLIER